MASIIPSPPIFGLTSGRVPVANGAASITSSSFTISSTTLDLASAGTITLGGTATTISLGATSLKFAADGSAVGLSALGTGVIRYNNSTHAFEQSVNGGAYGPLGASIGNYVFSGNTVDLSASATMAIGSTNTAQITLKSNSTGLNVLIDTFNLFNSGGALLQINNQGTRKVYIDGNGGYFSANGFIDNQTVGGTASLGSIQAGTIVIGNAANTTTQIFNGKSFQFNGAASTGSAANSFFVQGGAHTSLTTAVENVGANFNFNITKQWVAGTVATQREILFQAPTYTGASATAVFTNAATVAISGPPIAGANASITNPWALYIGSGNIGMAAGAGIDTITAGTLALGANTANTVTLGGTGTTGRIFTVNSSGAQLAFGGGGTYYQFTATALQPINNILSLGASSFGWTGAYFVPAGTIQNSAAGATNTTGLNINPSIADGASTIGVAVTPSATLTNGVSMAVNNNGLGTNFGRGLTLGNSTPANGVTTFQVAPALEFAGTYWTGSAAAADNLQLRYNINSGSSDGFLEFYTLVGSTQTKQFQIEFANAAANNNTVLWDATKAFFIQLQGAAAYFGSATQSYFEATTAHAKMWSPNHAGYLSTDDVTGTLVNYNSNQLLINSVDIQANIGGTGHFMVSGASIFASNAPYPTAVFKNGSSQTHALISAQDSNGNGHWGIDSQALPSLGTVSEWKEDWRWSATMTAITAAGNTFLGNSANVWTASITNGVGTSVNTVSTATGAYPSVPFIQIQSGTNSSNIVKLVTSPYLLDVSVLTNLVAVFEVDAGLNNTATNNLCNFWIGLGSTDISSTHPNALYFRKLSADAQWFCYSDDGVTTNNLTTTNVATSNNAMNTFRIEFYGSASALGAKTAKFYINGTLVATSVANLPTSRLYWQFVASPTSTSNVSMYVGRIRCWWNNFASPFIP